MLHMMFKLGQCAEENWRRLRGFAYLAKLIEGVEFVNGEEVTKPGQVAAWNRALNRRYGMENLRAFAGLYDRDLADPACVECIEDEHCGVGCIDCGVQHCWNGGNGSTSFCAQCASAADCNWNNTCLTNLGSDMCFLPYCAPGSPMVDSDIDAAVAFIRQEGRGGIVALGIRSRVQHRVAAGLDAITQDGPEFAPSGID